MSDLSSGEQWSDLKDPRDRASCIAKVMDQIEEDQCGWMEATLSHLRMYRNMALMGIGPFSYARADATLGAPLSLNVVRSMVNTVHSKLTKSRPRGYAQTSGATYKQKKTAEKLTRYGDGLFYQTKMYQQTPMVALDLLVMGTGVMKSVVRDGHVVNTHIFSPNLRVDTVEGMHRQPQNFYEICHIPRGKLKRMFPDKAEEIQNLRPIEQEEDEPYASFIPTHRASDVVRVIECYHLASEDGAEDGRMVQCAGELELDSGPWHHDWSPYTPVRWSTSNLGWYGMGLAEELKGIQIEINRLVRKIQYAFQILSNPYILASRSSNIAKGHLTDIPGSVIYYNGEKPQVIAPGVVHAEVFAHLDRLYQRAYEIAGVSQMSAMLKPPQSFESGRAQLIYEDAEDNRFASVFRAWEDFHMEVLEKDIKLAKSIKGYKVKVFGEESFEELNFQKDIGLKDEEYVMRIMPVAYISGTPSEQVNQAERLMKMGLIRTPEDALEQVDASDIKAFVRRNISPKKLIEKQVQSMLDGGPQLAPDPQMNLSMCADLGQLMYNEAKENEYPPESLRKVRSYIIAATRQLKSANQGGQAAQGAAPPVQPISPTGEMMSPGAPGAAPGAPNPMGQPGVAA